MIPILYESTETAFASNGLGRLRDMISCVVTEERNGIYELDFEYPMSAEDFDQIKIGRIIGVTHDDTGDIQPFDIVSYDRPIEGVVTFHAVHISYRLSYSTVRTGTTVNSLADAFTLLVINAHPSIPFTFETDKTSTGFCAALNTIPKTIRQVLGGTEGSILDSYGGEYEWDRFTVRLLEARGQRRDFQIRYGVNMVDYEEECDTQGCYSSVRPYWTDGTDSVIGDKQDSGSLPPSGRDQCVPLDLSDKFENKPSKAQVEAMAQSVMNANTPYLPVQNIHVEFIRLQDMPEYQGFGNLLRCNLCDTIQVIFPDYNSSGWFKIVKTEWNVLRDRYESMELGDLSMSLSEALGIDNSQSDSKSGSDFTTEIVNIGANDSGDISFENSQKGAIFGAGGGNAKVAVLVNTTSTGSCSSLKVAGATNMTVTNGTNKVTIANGYSYGMTALVVKWY